MVGDPDQITQEDRMTDRDFWLGRLAPSPPSAAEMHARIAHLETRNSLALACICVVGFLSMVFR